MQNSMMLFTFLVFDRKSFLCANLVEKVKISSLSWNLVLRLILICRIRWWSSLFLFLTGNTLFGQIRPKKIKIVNLSWNFVDSLIQICRIQWCCSIFSFSIEIPFCANLVQKMKIISLRWNLLHRLSWICKNQWCRSVFLVLAGNSIFGQIWSIKSKLSV